MEEKNYELQDKIKTIKKYKWLIFNCFFFAGVIAAVVSFMLTPTYESETTLRVHQSLSVLSNTLPINDTSNKLMATYAEILKSRGVVETTIEKANFPVDKKPIYEDMLKRITVQMLKDTELLSVKVQASNPEEAKKLSGLLAASFDDRLTALVRAEQKGVRNFIGARLEESKQELAKAEQALADYKRDQKAVALTEKTRALVDWQTAINRLSADNRVAIVSAQARVGSAEQQLAGENVGVVADNPLIQQYKGKLADQKVEMAGLLAKYNDQHPKVLAVQATIEETRAGLNTEISKVINSEAPSLNMVHQLVLQNKILAQSEIAATGAQQSAIARILAEGEQELANLPAKEQGLAKVTRDATVAQDLYTMLAKRYEEAKISEVMQPTEVQVVDLAATSVNPVKPAKALNIIVASLLGLLIGIGTAVVLGTVNRTIDNAEDVRRYLDLPVIASIPAYGPEEKREKS